MTKSQHEGDYTKNLPAKTSWAKFKDHISAKLKDHNEKEFDIVLNNLEMMT